MKAYNTIGLMSGTSLDGLDIAYCRFNYIDEKWDYEIVSAETIPYDNHWEERLKNAQTLSGKDLIVLHNDYGKYIGQQVNKYLAKYEISNIDLIASHGHTIFHQPKNQITFQAGNPAFLAAETRSKVIADFRSLDVAMGGQGAPLVPIGDKLLFSEFDFCLNLGGFANISFVKNNKTIAFDICPANFVINKLIIKKKIPLKDYFNCEGSLRYLKCDPDGFIASKGKSNMELLEKLNNLEYYKSKGPKSLGEEWVVENIWPILKSYNLPIENLLNTYYHHIVMQIQNVVDNEKGEKLLITGGGAFNKYLIKLLKRHLGKQICIPSKKIIDYKEALIFAFMGLLRVLEKENSLSSVTGSSADNIGGLVFIG